MRPPRPCPHPCPALRLGLALASSLALALALSSDAAASPTPPATAITVATGPAAALDAAAPAPEVQEPPPLLAPPGAALLASAAPGASFPPARGAAYRTQVRVAVGWSLTALGGAATVAGLVAQPLSQENLPFISGLVPILATGAGLVLIGQFLVHARFSSPRP